MNTKIFVLMVSISNVAVSLYGNNTPAQLFRTEPVRVGHSIYATGDDGKKQLCRVTKVLSPTYWQASPTEWLQDKRNPLAAHDTIRLYDEDSGLKHVGRDILFEAEEQNTQSGLLDLLLKRIWCFKVEDNVVLDRNQRDLVVPSSRKSTMLKPSLGFELTPLAFNALRPAGVLVLAGIAASYFRSQS